MQARIFFVVSEGRNRWGGVSRFKFGWFEAFQQAVGDRDWLSDPWPWCDTAGYSWVWEPSRESGGVGVGSGLVGLHVKDTLAGEFLAISRN